MQDHLIYNHQDINHWPNLIITNENVQARNMQLVKQLQSIHHEHQRNTNHRRYNDQSISKILPSGPPPFRPSSLMLGLGTSGALDKLKRTKMFKRMYKSKVYYLFLDVLQQLNILVDKMAKKKIDVTGAHMAAIQATVSQLALKGGHSLKLKWPLVMLNPHFIKEILSSPTFLVMLFHAIEVAYTSLPAHFWLKPLVKLVKQPSPEKEEKIWWRRKRFYDTLNGHGSSELEPNLKTIHFKNPGSPTPVAFPTLTSIIRHLAGKPPPNPRHYKYPVNNVIVQPDFATPHDGFELMENNLIEAHPTNYDLMNLGTTTSSGDDSAVNHHANEMYMTTAQEESFLANQSPHSSGGHHNHHYVEETKDHDVVSASESKTTNQQTRRPPAEVHQSMNVDYRSKSGNGQSDRIVVEQEGWLTQVPSKDELMSQQEFDSLDAHERELVLREARDRFEESRLTNELIKQQNDFVDSFVNRRDDLIARPVAINGNKQSKSAW